MKNWTENMGRVQKSNRIASGNRARTIDALTDRETRDELREYTIGTSCPLLASAPIDQIVRGRDILDRNVNIVRYADGQTLEIRTRPETSPERIREIAEGI